MKKILFIFLTFIVIVGCSNQTEAPKIDIPDETELNLSLTKFETMVSESTFPLDFGDEAWRNYQELEKNLVYRDSLYRDNDGSSLADVTSLIDTLLKKSEYEISEVDLGDGFNMVVFHYLDPTAAEFYNYADLTFYFESDNLLFSAITVGPYEIRLGSVILDSELESVYVYDDLHILSNPPQFLGVATFTVNDIVVNQLNIPTASDADASSINANYLYLDGSEVITYYYINLQQVMHDFASYSIANYFQFMTDITSSQ